MAYPATELVSRAWYLSGIVARRLQSVTGDQLTNGIDMLNGLLDWNSIALDLIPYWQRYTLTAVPSQETYFIPNCLAIESVTFNIGPVRYPIEQMSRRDYFATGRVDDISSLPSMWYFNRGEGGTEPGTIGQNGGTLYLYFLPAGNYPLDLTAKFGLTDVTPTTDLSTVYDAPYLEYLRYALAQYMCSEYGVLFNPESAKILSSIKRSLMDVSPPDLSVKKSSMLTQGTGINFGDVNVGRGYRP